MAADDTVRAMAYQAVADLVVARTREVEDIEENIALLQGHLERILSSFASPIFPPGFEPRSASQQNSEDALEAAQYPSDVDRSLSLAGLVGCSGSPTTCIETAVDPNNSPAERLSSLPSPIHAVESLGLHLCPPAAEGGCGILFDKTGPRSVHKDAEPEARVVRQENRCENTEVLGKDRSLALNQVEEPVNFVNAPRLLASVGASEDQKASYEAGSCSLPSKLTWEELATRVTTENPETVFDWAILGAQGVCQNAEEEKALENFFETRLEPHSKSAPPLSFSDLDNYKRMFQWLIVEEAKAVYEGCLISWNHPQQKCAWSMQETVRPAGCLFRTLRVDPLQQGHSVSNNLSSYQMNDVVTVFSPILRQIKRVAIVDGVEGEFIRLRSRFGCDPSLNQQCIILKMSNLTLLRRMYMAVSRASWIYRPLLQQLLRPAAPVEATSMPPGAGLENEYVPPEHRFLLSWASLKLLDDSQLRTIAALLKMQHGFLLVQGGPGTGKTTAIVGMVSALLVHEPSTKILVCAKSNTTVNHIYTALMHGMVDEAGKAISPDIFHLGCARDSENTSDRSTADAHTQLVCLQRATVVCTTLTECGGIQAPLHFDVVIVDEAHQAIEAEAIMALRPGVKRCVLVGDPHQLRSKVHQKPSTVFERSLLERLQDAGMPVHMLKAQYRMHPNIAKFPFYQFYGVCVESAKRFVDGIYTRDACDVGILSQGYRIKPSEYCFLDVDQLGRDRHDTKELLTTAVVEAVILSLKPGVRPHIGVITSCSGDVIAIADELKQFGVSEAECEVNTVEGFQGREKDVIVLSCFSRHAGGSSYFTDDRMLNVALTRAKHSLIIVGHASSIQEKSWSWEALLEDVKKRGGYQVLCQELKGVRNSTKNMEENVVDYKQVSEIDQREIGEKLPEIQDNGRAEEWGGGRTNDPYQTGNKNQTASLPKVSNEKGFNLEREGGPIANGGSIKQEDQAVLMGLDTPPQSQEQGNMEDQRKKGKESEMDEKATADEAGASTKKFHGHCNDVREHGYSVNKYSDDDIQKRSKYQESVEQDNRTMEGADGRRNTKRRKQTGFVSESDSKVEKEKKKKEKKKKKKEEEQQLEEVEVRKRKGISDEERKEDGITSVNMLREGQQERERDFNAEKRKHRGKGIQQQPTVLSRKEQKVNEELEQPKDRTRKRKKEINEDEVDGTRSKRRKKDKEQEQEQEDTEKTRSKKGKMKRLQIDFRDVVGRNANDNAQGRGDKYSRRRRSVSPSDLPVCAEKRKGKKKPSPMLVDSVKGKVKKSKLSSDDAVEEKRTSKRTKRKDDNVGTQVTDSVKNAGQHQVGSLVEKTRTGKQKNRANDAVDEAMVNTGKKVKKVKMVAEQELGLDAGEPAARSVKSSRNKSSTRKESRRTTDSADADSPNRIQDSHIGSLVKETGIEKRTSRKDETMTQAVADDVTTEVKSSKMAAVDGVKLKVKKVKLAAFEKTSSNSKVKKSAADRRSSIAAGELEAKESPTAVKEKPSSKTKSRKSSSNDMLMETEESATGTKRKKPSSKMESRTSSAFREADVLIHHDRVDQEGALVAKDRTSKRTSRKGKDEALGTVVDGGKATKVKKSKSSAVRRLPEDAVQDEPQPIKSTRKKASSKQKHSKSIGADEDDTVNIQVVQDEEKGAGKQRRRRADSVGEARSETTRSAVKKSKLSNIKKRESEDIEPLLISESHVRQKSSKHRIKQTVQEDGDDVVGKRTKRKRDTVDEARSETERSAVERSKPPKKKKRQHDESECSLVGSHPGKQRKSKHRIGSSKDDPQQTVQNVERGTQKSKREDSVGVAKEGTATRETESSAKKKKRLQDETGSDFVGAHSEEKKKRKRKAEQEDKSTQGNTYHEVTGRATSVERLGMDELSLELAKKAAAAAFWQSLIECKRIR